MSKNFLKEMSVNKIRPCIKKERHFKGLGRFLKIDSTSSTYLWNWSSATLETREPLSL